jgi:hypothetical protein
MHEPQHLCGDGATSETPAIQGPGASRCERGNARLRISPNSYATGVKVLVVEDNRPAQRGRDYFSDARSMTKRYFTSPLSMRSYASLIFWIGMSSMSETISCSAQ